MNSIVVDVRVLGEDRHRGQRSFRLVISMLLIFAMISAPTMAGGARAQTTSPSASGLSGAWQLTNIETIRPNGEIIYPFYGKKPQGTLLYDPSGWMSVQIVSDPRPSVPIADTREGFRAAAPAERAAAADGYYAYTGTYTVDAATSTVTHHVEESLYPAERGQDFKRHYSIQGGRLTLIASVHEMGEDHQRRLTFERLTNRAVSGQPALASHDVYPGTAWHERTPAALGWSISALTAARRFVDTLPPASILVIDRGLVAVSWGDPTLRIKISSMRKSLLSALYGIYAPQIRFNLDATLEDLGIDDDPPLTQEEKRATVRMLLEARSGIYHAYVAGTPAMREGRPARGSHSPGSFWYYNNWDFNALGTIFEKEFGTSIAQAFEDRIAKPTGMQDFRLDDMYYLKASADAAPDFDKSMHPAYHFRSSARDLARFGYLYLRKGRWSGKQVVPEAWVSESTRSHSTVGADEGYGYLWWVDGFGLSEHSFSAQGALAKYVVVIPARDLVIVYLNHTEFPDDTAGMSAADVKALPSISHEQMSELLNRLLQAQQPELCAHPVNRASNRCSRHQRPL